MSLEPLNAYDLFIVGCTAAKLDCESARAIDLYQGATVQALRKAGSFPCPTFFLSAKYGLVKYDAVIVPYEQRMTPQRAREMALGTTFDVVSKVNRLGVKRLVLSVGPDYEGAIDIGEVAKHCDVVVLQGTLGQRNTMLDLLLFGHTRELSAREQAKIESTTFGGVPVTVGDVESVVRQLGDGDKSKVGVVVQGKVFSARAILTALGHDCKGLNTYATLAPFQRLGFDIYRPAPDFFKLYRKR